MSETEKSRRSWFQRAGYNTIKWMMWCVCRLFFGIRVAEGHKIPTSGGALVCGNHQSHLDPVLFGVSTRRPMNYLAKKELFRYPPMSWLIRFLDAIPIDRDGFSAGAIKEVMKRLKRGEMVLMFPEGTRTPDGELKEIKPGFLTIARRTKVALIPCGVTGSFEAWPRKRKLPRPGVGVRVTFGDPIFPDEYQSMTDEQLQQELESRIRACIAHSQSMLAQSPAAKV